MKDITFLFKQAIKPAIEAAEEKLQEGGSKLEKKTKSLLDTNKDGILTQSDIIFMLMDFVDTDGDGKASIWEYIAVLFQIRKILRKLKK